MEVIKYLIGGEEVHLQEKLESGYLVRRVLYADLDEEEGEPEEAEGNIEFVDKVFDSPPTEKLHSEVLELTKKKELLESELSRIRLLKNSEESLLNKINKIPNFPMIVDYFNGDYKFLLDVKRLVIRDSYHTYKNPNIAITMISGKDVVFYTIRGDYHSSDKDEVEIFKTLEEAQVARKTHFMQRICNMGSWGYDDLFKNSDHRDLFLQADVMELFNQKKAEAEKKNIENKIENAKKAIQENMKILKDNNIEL